eukprot:tig00020510_g9910.t1
MASGAVPAVYAATGAVSGAVPLANLNAATGPGHRHHAQQHSNRAGTAGVAAGPGAAAVRALPPPPPPVVSGPSVWERYQEVTAKVAEQRLALTTAMIQAGKVDLGLVKHLIREFVLTTYGAEFWDESSGGLKPWNAVASIPYPGRGPGPGF